ncbi:MAG: DNA mismatch repair protein MutS [Alphaproteobacteria bacterium]|nr:DNA mismatch repair protein MutS [Alphaproteobacteria bacterium]MCB9928738.1 DNA mismatch repair protein MutS [Alphaproteobacteria bacterium]
MMAQYLALKEANEGFLLFYRMGDFYEMFFDDAVRAAPVLNIALTKRGRHGGEDIPMAGVPVKSHEAYLHRLIGAGFKVAICEQTEDPAEAKKRGSKSVVARDVVRRVTRGTLTEDSLLDARQHNHLAALAEVAGEFGLAWVDISTGSFTVQTLAEAGLAAALARLAPNELLLSERLLEREPLFELWAEHKAALSPLPGVKFDTANGHRRLLEAYRVASLEAYGQFTRPEIAAAGALFDYLDLTQVDRLPRLDPPRHFSGRAAMEIDAATRRNLELTEALSGGRDGTLLAAIDRTVTGAGARLLYAWLSAPLTDSGRIAARLDAVQFLCEGTGTREDLREQLGRCPDLARALQRLSLERGGPRDLAAVREAARIAGVLRVLLGTATADLSAQRPELLADTIGSLGQFGPLVERLGRALAPDLPANPREGGFIAPGYAPELDELRTLRDDSRRHIAGLQKRYAEETGVANLRVKHNNVLGYFVEVGQNQAARLQEDDRFVHRQTMASAMRFTTVELSDLEARILQAGDRSLALELDLFADLVREVAARADDLARTAEALALLDVLGGLADLAVDLRYNRPAVDNTLAFKITGGRHPVVEAVLTAAGQAFVANDCDLSADRDPAERLWLVTGPNMAGKSTYLRQNALIAILAQIGSFVPADAAHIGVVDRLFSRVGAADDLARGRSTFMVEMVETAAILNQAGPRALVILDEIGRGTATFDGLSIAWAAVEHLHDRLRCRALFATHYHELTLLEGRLDALHLATMRIREWQDQVVFLHEVAAGTADRSYGIHVARLAGLPKPVLARAEEVLKLLEEGDQGSAVRRLVEDLPLFAAAAPKPPPAPEVAAAPATPPPPRELLRVLGETDPDSLTPREALDMLYRLKRLADGED